MKIETTAEAFVEAVLQMGTTLQQAKTAILKMSSSRDAENRKNTNNWRKMHGLPMRRKQKARKSMKEEKEQTVIEKPCYILKIIVKWNDTSTRQYQRPLKCRI